MREVSMRPNIRLIWQHSISIPFLSIAVLAKAIHSFSRIGCELYLEVDSHSGLSLRTVNMTKSAFASISFNQDFFSSFSVKSKNIEDNQCKLSMKSCVGVFRNMKQVSDERRRKLVFNLLTRSMFFSPISRWKHVQFRWMPNHTSWLYSFDVVWRRFERITFPYWSMKHFRHRTLPIVHWMRLVEITSYSATSSQTSRPTKRSCQSRPPKRMLWCKIMPMAHTLTTDLCAHKSPSSEWWFLTNIENWIHSNWD